MSQQINEVFGSINEERADTTVPTGSASVSLTNGTGNGSSSNVESSGMKRSREESCCLSPMLRELLLMLMTIVAIQ